MMKSVLLFFVLLNALFFGWSQWVAPPPGGPVVATAEADAPRLVLFREAYPDIERPAELDLGSLEMPDEGAARAGEIGGAPDAGAADGEAANAGAADAGVVNSGAAGAGAGNAGKADAGTDGDGGSGDGSSGAEDVAPPEAAPGTRDAAAGLRGNARSDTIAGTGAAADARAAMPATPSTASASAPAPAPAPAPDGAAVAPGATAAADSSITAGSAAAAATSPGAPRAPGASSNAQRTPATVTASLTEAPAVLKPPATSRQAAAARSSPSNNNVDPGASGSAAPPDAAASGDAPATDAATVALATDMAGARCVELGPFARLRQATEASARLRELGLQPAQRLEESEIWSGHWVHLVPYATRQEAVAVVEMLREGGITDLYIEPSGDMRNAVSLGLFSDIEGAETRAGRVRKLGVKPQIRDRRRTGTVYWLDFVLPPSVDIDPAGFAPQPKQPIEMNDRGCAAATGG